MANTTEEIKSKLDIVDVVGGYVKLERAGGNLKARCPFHNEKTASFFISPERQTYHCFGCNRGGDIFSFVEEIEGLDFKGALKILAEKAGVQLGNFSPKEKSEKDAIFEVLEASTLFFQQSLGTKASAQEYLSDRGITKDTIKDFRIGFVPNEWRALNTYLLDKGYANPLIEKAGMAKRSEKGYYDRFRGRIMFPVADSSGRIVGFSGRILPEFEEKEGAKYINNPETLVYDKSKVLYGFDKAKMAIRQKGECVVVEGQMDLILSHQAGVANTVAVSGTALTEKHLTAIKRLADKLIFAFDADQAGIAAARKGFNTALSLGMEVRIVKLPKGNDPADIIKNSKEEWERAVSSSTHIINFLLGVLDDANLKPREYGIQVSKVILPYVKVLESNIEQGHFIKIIAEKLSMDEAPLWEELKKIEISHSVAQPKVEEDRDSRTRGQRIKRKIGGALLWQKEKKKPDIDVAYFEKELKRIAGEESLRKLYEAKEDKQKEYIFEAEVEYGETEDITEVIKELFSNLENDLLREEFTVAMTHLKEAEAKGDEKKKQEYQETCNKIIKKLGDFNKK